MNRIKYPLMCALLALAACETPKVWLGPPGSTRAEVNRWTYECERDVSVLRHAAITAPAPQNPYLDLGYIAAAEANEMFARCMESKGFRLIEDPRKR